MLNEIMEMIQTDDIKHTKEKLNAFFTCDIVQRMSEHMVSLNISIENLALHGNVTHPTVLNWLKELSPSNKKKLKELCTVFQIYEAQCIALLNLMIELILVDDIEHIKEQLSSFKAYDFAVNIRERMACLGLSNSALADRANVSHTMVNNWLNGAKPHGKERFKELGMALAMDEEELNMFLCANCYPKLYAKNPKDLICRFVIRAFAGNGKILTHYYNYLKEYGLLNYDLGTTPEEIATTVLSRDFADVKTAEALKELLEKYNKYTRAIDKGYIPNSELIHFIMLYIGKQTIHNLYKTGKMPITIKNLLFPLLADKAITVKGLRAKLIVFGLYENMTEDEIDVMLEMTRLQPLSEPLTRIDHVILTALRCAHERYPYYEQKTAEKVLAELSENDPLYPIYKKKKGLADSCVHYYEANDNIGVLQLLFEKTYTDYNDSGIIQYIPDVFSILVRDNILLEEEVSEYTALMKVYQNGE